MTTITWKNGGPLFLQPASGSEYGLVASDQNCCCPPPPPDRCWCGSNCSYFIELVEPLDLAVRSNVFDCTTATSHQKTTSSLLQAIVPVLQGDLGDFSFPPSYSLASAESGDISLYILAHDEIHGFPTFLPPELYYLQLRGAYRSASVAVFCEIDQVTQQPKHYAKITLVAGARYVFESLGFTPVGFWARTYEGVFELPEECIVSSGRECVASGQEFLRITTPVEITLNGDGTSSLGNLNIRGDSGGDSVPPEFPYAKNTVETILSATSYTFRITSRPSCRTGNCNCAAPLGGMRVDLGNLKQVSSPTPSSYQVSSSLIDTVWMYDRSDETVYWEGPFGLYEYDQKDPDGGQDGNGKFTRLLWRQRAELYCNLIDGVAQWFVLFTSIGIIYDEAGTITHYSEDEWVGKIDCYEACEDVDNYINAGDFVPMGEPYEIEYMGRTTQPGTLECEPPPRITIRFTQIKTC
jgi:hypothetical protein